MDDMQLLLTNARPKTGATDDNVEMALVHVKIRSSSAQCSVGLHSSNIVYADNGTDGKGERAYQSP